MGIISLNEYKNEHRIFEALKAIILREAGIKYKTKGYKSPKAKLEIESFIKAIWVFSYTEQKQEMAYQ